MGKEPVQFCPPDMEMRARIAYKEATVSVIGNVALFALKLVLGLMISSISLIADSFHSLSDVGSSVVVFFGFTPDGSAQIGDPADRTSGRTLWTIDRLERCWSGVGLRLVRRRST